MRKRIGRYLEADPSVCHGKLCFRGTRVLVSDVLQFVADGIDWDEIVKQYRGSISRPAIAEAIRAASKTLAKHANLKRASA